MNASVQSLELNKNTYAKSENFTGKGALTLESLQESFDKNKQLAFSNVDSKIIYDNTGITLSTNGIDDKTGETIENKYQVKLVGGGIILSSDGGQTWKTGIYGGEINTALLRAGQIDAELINIMMGTVPTFKWDKDGLVAYGQTTDKEGKTVVVKTGQRVVFDGEGIRGYYEKGENDTYNTPNFSLTHGGLTIDNPYDHTMDRVPVISVNGNANPDSEGHSHKFIVYNDGSLEAYNGTFTGTINGVDGIFSGTITAAEFKGMNRGKLIGPELMVGLKSGASSESEKGEDYNFWVDSNGNVKITGGSISFEAFSDDAKNTINGKVDNTTFENAINNINTTINGLPRIPDYIKETYIDATQIKSPTITGNNIKVHGSFQTLATTEESSTVTGYMGYAQGSMSDANGNVTLTDGVGISTNSGTITDTTTFPYVIVTTAGARMSANGGGLLVSNGYAYFKENNGNWQRIGSGKAVFG